MPLSALKFHFFQITFFSAVITRTHNLPTHTLFFRHIMSKKNALYTFFLKLPFFALYSFSLPPKHFLIIFSGKLTTKNGQKTCRKEEKFFFFFFIIYFTFSLSPYGKKQNHLLFPPFLSLEIVKPQGKTSDKKFFFFFFYLTFLDPTAPHNQKNYHLPFFFEIST